MAALTEYQARRDLTVTPEPGGGTASPSEQPVWATLQGAQPAELPETFRPAVATPADEVPDGEDWLHEVVLQGVRLLAFLQLGGVRLLGPDNRDWCSRLPHITAELERLELDGSLLDGTLVALRDDGTSDRDLLVEELEGDGERLRLFVTDAVFLGGYDLTKVALEARKDALRNLVSQGQHLRFGDHVKGQGEPFRRQACRFAVHGVLSRKASGRYCSGPDPDWKIVGCGKELKVKIAGVDVSNPDREMYPEVGVTKADLARYYRQVAGLMLPHLEDRPLSLVRCPQGHEKQCFFQKHEMKGLPDSVHTITIEEKEGTGEYLYLRDLEGLIALVQLGTLEFHPWGSRVDRLESPDRMIFDLDPGPGLGLPHVIEAGLALRELLSELGLQSFARVSGGKGLHLVVPLLRRHDWEEVKTFSRLVCEALERRHPDRYTVNSRKKKRQGKLFLDYLRNGRGATAIASYSTRARAGAPLALPVAWDEVTPELAPDAFTLKDWMDSPRPDPWEGFFEVRQGLTKSAWSVLDHA